MSKALSAPSDWNSYPATCTENTILCFYSIHIPRNGNGQWDAMSPYHHSKCLKEFYKLSKESDAALLKSWQIRNWQSTTSGFLLDWRNELMASLTCARSSTGCTALRAGVYQSILNPQRKGCCSKTKADEFGWQTDQHLFSSISQVFCHVAWSSLIL